MEKQSNHADRYKRSMKLRIQAAEVLDYEVLRQEGGDLALVFNAGVLPISPERIFLDQGNLQLLARSEEGRMKVIGWIKEPHPDVISAVNSSDGLLVVELSTLGVHSAQSLHIGKSISRTNSH